MSTLRHQMHSSRILFGSRSVRRKNTETLLSGNSAFPLKAAVEKCSVTKSQIYRTSSYTFQHPIFFNLQCHPKGIYPPLAPVARSFDQFLDDLVTVYSNMPQHLLHSTISDTTTSDWNSRLCYSTISTMVSLLVTSFSLQL